MMARNDARASLSKRPKRSHRTVVEAMFKMLQPYLAEHIDEEKVKVSIDIVLRENYG